MIYPTKMTLQVYSWDTESLERLEEKKILSNAWHFLKAKCMTGHHKRRAMADEDLQVKRQKYDPTLMNTSSSSSTTFSGNNKGFSVCVWIAHGQPKEVPVLNLPTEDKREAYTPCSLSSSNVDHPRRKLRKARRQSKT